MKNTLEIVGNVLLIILAIDLFGFMVWIASGQKAGFYQDKRVREYQ